jgi:hypothetical protein
MEQKYYKLQEELNRERMSKPSWASSMEEISRLTAQLNEANQKIAVLEAGKRKRKKKERRR